MPLFRLLPGRPRRIFSSWTAFLGGILPALVLRLWRRAEMRKTVVTNAELAAAGCTRCAREWKEEAQDSASTVVMETGAFPGPADLDWSEPSLGRCTPARCSVQPWAPTWRRYRKGFFSAPPIWSLREKWAGYLIKRQARPANQPPLRHLSAWASNLKGPDKAFLLLNTFQAPVVLFSVVFSQPRRSP